MSVSRALNYSTLNYIAMYTDQRISKTPCDEDCARAVS